MIIFKPHEVFKYIKPHLPDDPTIVEAGSFKGQDTIKMALCWPKGTVHAFEPVPQLFEELKYNTAHLPNVHCYQLALSNKNGTATFWTSEHPKKPGTPSQAGSLLPPKERLSWSNIQFKDTIEVQTITLDSWAKQYKIDHVDFLWLDLQGYELYVLQASPTILTTGSTLHTEVQFVQAYEGHPLYPEVRQWIEKQGFSMIARDFTDNPAWFFGNALIVKKRGLTYVA